MPGVHTFYDGSKLLEPLSEAVGVEVDKVNLVFCQFSSIVFALFYYFYLAPGIVSRNLRVVFPPLVGLSFCYFCYGSAIKHLLAKVAIGYLILWVSPRKHVHRVMFIFAMGYLIFIHWFRWYILTSYSIDITGPMMVISQKLTTMAFSLHDGTVKKEEELNEYDTQKREAIREVPPALDYLSYIFHFQSVLTGPLCFYNDYMRFISGDNVKERGPNGKVATPWKAATTKLMFSFVFFAIILLAGSKFAPEQIAEKEQMKMAWLPWMGLFFMVIMMQRFQYYFAWTLADAICNLSGFGFQKFDEHGNEDWDLVRSVDPWRVEMALSFKDVIDAWNITTQNWLRRVAYHRLPPKMRTFGTYLLSALWHGFFPGYYLTFLTGALMTVSGRQARRCLRHRFQGSKQARIFYDILTFTVTKITLAYATFPFVTMHWNPGFFIYRKLYFCIHILALAVAIGLPFVAKPLPRKKGNEKSSVKKTE
ncbi:hypothetical protein QR680_017836 [Steinernema hermaphroditum]|uniref:Uncharacterized protein n=1 Tax=Steinernema hermaphroditum TaxID=289476 RepID=A0AA39LQ09_9BILA|nr:hypothetical protein QR680_017836 [Steinernema hermaphroditum]